MFYVPEFKKSPLHLLKKFAVCDISLYDICDYNVTRQRCKQLGCCFYKGICYEKAVPIYVQVFFAWIMIIVGGLIITIIYRVVQHNRKGKGVYTEIPLSSKSADRTEASRSGKETESKTPTTGTSRKSGGTEGKDATVTIMDDEDTEN